MKLIRIVHVVLMNVRFVYRIEYAEAHHDGGVGMERVQLLCICQ